MHSQRPRQALSRSLIFVIGLLAAISIALPTGNADASVGTTDGSDYSAYSGGLIYRISKDETVGAGRGIERVDPSTGVATRVYTQQGQISRFIVDHGVLLVSEYSSEAIPHDQLPAGIIKASVNSTRVVAVNLTSGLMTTLASASYRAFQNSPGTPASCGAAVEGTSVDARGLPSISKISHSWDYTTKKICPKRDLYRVDVLRADSSMRLKRAASYGRFTKVFSTGSRTQLGYSETFAPDGRNLFLNSDHALMNVNLNTGRKRVLLKTKANIDIEAVALATDDAGWVQMTRLTGKPQQNGGSNASIKLQVLRRYRDLQKGSAYADVMKAKKSIKTINLLGTCGRNAAVKISRRGHGVKVDLAMIAPSGKTIWSVRYPSASSSFVCDDASGLFVTGYDAPSYAFAPSFPG